jgi:hypothetical protein
MPYSGQVFAERAQNGARTALGMLHNRLEKLGLAGKVDYLFGDLAPEPDDRFPENPAEVAVAAYISDLGTVNKPVFL